MKHLKLIGVIGILFLFLSACVQTHGSGKDWKIPEVPFPLSEPGPYFVGRQDYRIIDKSRNNREILVEFWYPAKEKMDENGKVIKYQAAPDKSGAPYPLILTEHRSGRNIFGEHLASHGFVMAIITVPDHADLGWDYQMIEWPRDFLYGLDQIATNPPEELKKIINTNAIGVTGYSFGGDISITLSGAQIDPKFYLAYCENPPRIATSYFSAEEYHKYTCISANKWEDLSLSAGESITALDNGLWQPLTDKRILAVMPMAASGTWLYGEKGLVVVKKPVLIIAPTADEFIPYSEETAYLFDHLGSSDKSMISFIGKGHVEMVQDDEQIKRMRHFATAFFGYYLQGRNDYQMYYSKEFVSKYSDLHWGIYSEE
jgi:predicted dienelactone hydrolase